MLYLLFKCHVKEHFANALEVKANEKQLISIITLFFLTQYWLDPTKTLAEHKELINSRYLILTSLRGALKMM